MYKVTAVFVECVRMYGVYVCNEYGEHLGEALAYTCDSKVAEDIILTLFHGTLIR